MMGTNMKQAKFKAAMRALLIGTMTWLAAGAAWANVGMITQLSGEVTLSVAGKSQKAVPFLKLKAGDKLAVPADGSVKLVYFGNGRQEVWKGGAQVEVGSLEGKSGAKAEVSQLPPLVVNQLAKTPAPGQQGRTGMVRLRSLLDPDAADKLEAQYKDFKKQIGVDDPTAEVFYLSGLVEMREFSKARAVLDGLAGKAPYQSMIEHFDPVVKAGGR